MGSFFKILILFLVLYLIYSWILKIFKPLKKEKKSNKEVRIFKTKNVEDSKYEVEAETVEYEEIITEKPKE
ncbi:DUF4834 domain-containing protein [Candidatus Ornithobacterium hominis]|nr:DUF4834 domain-containing protein [Candidatus Ornithobacterium hominis]